MMLERGCQRVGSTQKVRAFTSTSGEGRGRKVEDRRKDENWSSGQTNRASLLGNALEDCWAWFLSF